MEITAKTAEQLRITEEEFELIKKKMGRTPNFTELSIFSVMWSEHCSYKNSIVWLKTLPKDSPRMLAKAGVKVVVDPSSAQLLSGATLDYKDGLTDAGFAINNPNAQKTCGCGQSFS